MAYTNKQTKIYQCDDNDLVSPQTPISSAVHLDKNKIVLVTTTSFIREHFERKISAIYFM
jgi:hypothetical protein